ncbi:MAG: hypothetical protein DDT36_00179 [Firmicutes bacterium]|nr:hypothetical protein [Bacillota bacterium]
MREDFRTTIVSTATTAVHVGQDWPVLVARWREDFCHFVEKVILGEKTGDTFNWSREDVVANTAGA